MRGHFRNAARWLWAAALFGAAACGPAGLKAQGEQCFGSSECAPGLVCNFGVEPPVCSPTGSEPTEPDAAPEPEVDAAPVPDAAPGEPDAAPLPDAAPPDAAEPDAAEPDAAEIDAALPDAAM